MKGRCQRRGDTLTKREASCGYGRLAEGVVECLGHARGVIGGEGRRWVKRRHRDGRGGVRRRRRG